MSKCLVALSVSTSTDGGNPSSAGLLDASDRISTDYPDLRQREVYQLATAGAVGAAFEQLDAPNIIQQLLLVNRSGSELAIRLNGAPAKVTGAGASFGTIVNGDTFAITLDQATLVNVTFLTGDITVALVIARINAALGAIVASQDASGNLVLTGVKTGGASALAKSMQYGSMVLSGAGLAKLGLTAGTTYGDGQDIRAQSKFFASFPSSGSGLVSSVWLSGSGELITHAAGRAS